MEEEASSWIRRTNYSHTVCHRLDNAIYATASTPNFVRDQNSQVKSRPRTTLFEEKSGQGSISMSRNRSVSPLPQTKLSNAFKEARSDRKRFSTPHPRRIVSEKRIDCYESNDHSLRSRASTSPFRHFDSIKIRDRIRRNKGSSSSSSWGKYFDHGGGRVTSVESGEEWMVDLSKLFLGLRFAHGAHSQLYHGIYLDETVAVKIIRIPDDDENGALRAKLERQFSSEVTLLSRLHFQNVIKFIAACRKQAVFCVITEYLSEGSLRAYLHKMEHEHRSLPLEKFIAFALDIARGMEYIHSQGVIHRDLKPENVLISEDFHMKIADFGIACEETQCDLLLDDPGTYRWMAPEMIKRKSYGRKVDVYSFGLILWEMVTGAIPYEEMTPVQAAFAVVNKGMRPAIPGDCPLALKALIEQCWSLKPHKRPEFWQVVKVLEQLKSSLECDGTLFLVEKNTMLCHDHKKGLRHWIQKLSTTTNCHGSTLSKPKFS